MTESNVSSESQPASTQETARVREEAAEFVKQFGEVRAELSRVIVGHESVIEGVLIALFAGGHVLLEGVPGLGKTLLVKTLGQALDLSFSRIQFTPDLMPADILGTNMVSEDGAGKRHFQFQRGPIFAQIVLADEINRATPKTQSALLEAMQEKKVTVSGTSYDVGDPFLVMATQNPLEMEGTYPLPEAQLDRFFFKLLVEPSGREELITILRRTTRDEEVIPRKILDGTIIAARRTLIRNVAIAPHVEDYAVRLTLATQPDSEFAPPQVRKFARYGSSPRGAQSLLLSAKVRALLDERYHVAFEDLESVAVPSLRHRIIVNFEADTEGITSDDLLHDILKTVPKT